MKEPTTDAVTPTGSGPTSGRRRSVSDVDLTVGQRIRNLRVDNGISLRELAAKSGMTAVLIGEIERDVTDPTGGDIAMLQRAFQALGVLNDAGRVVQPKEPDHYEMTLRLSVKGGGEKDAEAILGRLQAAAGVAASRKAGRSAVLERVGGVEPSPRELAKLVKSPTIQRRGW